MKGATAGPSAARLGALALTPAGTASQPYLELEALCVRFGSTWALRNATLTVSSGDLLALVGPDGAGKTTLLRVMAGLARPTSGRVVHHLSRDRLGFCGAGFDLYGDLTVQENLSFFGSVRSMSRAELATAGGRLLQLVGLTEARNRLAMQLSGGMKKKLSLAAALIHDPALLLLDEPTVGVDPGSRRELWDIVAQANAWGAAVVYTTPYLEEAERARRVVVLGEGEARDTSPMDLMRDAAGWKAWLVPLEGSRREVRLRLAQAALGPRVYLRPEGLAVLARAESEAAGLVAAVLGGGPGAGGVLGAASQPGLAQSAVTLEDAFVLAQGIGLGGGGVPEEGGS